MEDRTVIQPRTLAPGEIITEAGIWAGVPMARYHGADLCDGPSISSSGLRTIFRQSPAHYWAASPLNPERIETPDSEAFVLGRAAHHLLLGEDAFSTLFVVRPDKFDSWRSNAAKEWRAEQEAEGRTVLLPTQIETIRGMARSLAKHPLVANGILNGAIEQSIVWQDKETGVWLKARPDAIPTESGDFSDLKTTVSVQSRAIERTIIDYGYAQQAALIREGFELVTGIPMASFSLVMVEKDPPWCVRVVTLRGDDIALGQRQNRAALRRFVHCYQRDEWPGPGGADAEFVALPPWEITRIENDITLMEQELA